MKLAKEVGEIIKSPDEVYDLAGKRFALYSFQLGSHLVNNPTHIGIVGNPNRGKTSFAFSASKLMTAYGLPAQYFDLDDYTKSGDAISGSIPWSERQKRDFVSPDEAINTINKFSSTRGLVIGDFPGRSDNEYQPQRIASLDMAVLMMDNLHDGSEWQELLEKWDIPTSRLIIGKLRNPASDYNPIAPYLPREYKPFTIPMIIACTRILEDISYLKNIALLKPWDHMTQAERTILEELLDFEFAPIGINDEI